MEEVKINILLIGKTGQGKSATGNTLLDRPGFFKTSASYTSETKDVKFSCRQLENYMLQVVDGPGLEDTDMDTVEDKETAIKHFDEALAMCYGGVAAFIYVIKFNQRFTTEDRLALNALNTIFGSGFLKHVIVVATCGDLFQEEMQEGQRGISFDEWCRQQKGPFLQLYKDCDGRVVLLNNKERDNEKKMKQVQEIIQHADTLQKQNRRYTSQCFKNAERQREKMIVELKAPQLKEQIQQKVTLLAAELEKYSQNKNSSESQKNNIKERVYALKREITVQDKGFGVLNELMKLANEVERNLDDRIKLKVLAAQLEMARKAKTDLTTAGTAGTIFGAAAAFVAPPVGFAVAITGVLTAAYGYFGFGSKEKIIQQQHDELEKKISKK